MAGRSALVWEVAVLLLGAIAWGAPEGRVRAGADGRDEINTVTIEGRGASKDEAINDALRNAVERAAGQFIHSQSETKDYEIVLDKVLSKSAGFVKRYNVDKVIGPDEDGIIKVRLTADVAVKEVATEWGEIQILLQQKNKPRLMVVIGEKIDGSPQDESVVASEIEKQLLKNDFPLVDKTQLNEIQKKDMSEASFLNDINKVIAIGKQFGAELIVTGVSAADYGSEEDLFGVRAFMYGATVRVKVVRTDNAATLVSDNVNARKGSRTRRQAAAESLREAGAQMARRVQDGIVSKWGREVAESQSINLEVTGMVFAQRATFVATLKKLKIVRGVQARSLSNRVGTFTVDIKGSADDFAQALDELAEPKVEITDVTANAIKCKLVGQEKESE